MFDIILSDVYSVLSRQALANPEFKFYPANYFGEIKSKDFARISVLPGSSSNPSYGSGKKVGGLLVISIFTKSGAGDKKSFNIATSLAAEFDKALLAGGTQFNVGNVGVKGLDPENKSLYRVDYQNTFFIFRR